MKAHATFLNRAVATFVAVFLALSGVVSAALVSAALVSAGGAARAESSRLDELFSELSQPGNPDWGRVESDIEREWSRSGSPAMDLLLKRGHDAMEAGDYAAAIDHLTALTDHAPDFPEGWNARATAYFLAGYFGPSIADIQRTLDLEPRHFGALSGLAMIFEEMGNKAAALKAFRAAKAIHPNRPDLDSAVERLERALEGIPL